MFKTTFLFLLLVHILGDIYFQSDELAQQKNTSPGSLLKHCIIYAVICLLAVLPLYNFPLWGGIFLGVSHAVIDIIKYFYFKEKPPEKHINPEEIRLVYIFDQLLHLTTMVIIAFVITATNYYISVLPEVNWFFNIEYYDQKTYLTA